MKEEISVFIDKPCNKQWSTMQDAEGGKFCEHCNKVVHDFTGMTNDEIHNFYLQYGSKENLCGKLTRKEVHPWITFVDPDTVGDDAFRMGEVAVEYGIKTYVEKDLTDEQLDQLNLERDFDFDLLFTNEKFPHKKENK